MKTHDLSLYHIIRQPKDWISGQPLVILLHGVTTNEEHVFWITQHLDERFLAISVRAPNTLCPGSYAWYNLDSIPKGVDINAEEAENSRRAILRFIDEAVEAYDTAPDQVYLLGYSQGAIMSYSVMLTAPEKLAGVVAMSGRILPEVKPLVVSPERLTDFPVLVIHGVYDDVVPISYAHEARAYLETLPVKLTYKEYPIDHDIAQESLEAALVWLKRHLDAGQTATADLS